MRKSLDQKETKKIGAWLETIGATITDQNGDILHHATAPYNGPKKWRNKDGNSFEVKYNGYTIHYEAGINAAGVGDGQKPDKAMTYSLGIGLSVTERRFKCRNSYDTETYHFYSYSRTLEGLQNKFIKYLMTR